MKRFFVTFKGQFIMAVILLILGACLPLMTVSKFVIVSTSYSLLSLIFSLLANGQVILFVIVFLFSICLPIAKIYCLYHIIFRKDDIQSPHIIRYIKLMHDYGRWAMLDVMVVAVLIVASKLSVIASVDVHFGLYLFGISVIMIMLLTNRVSNLTNNETTNSK
jgi:paraquat-inducible protein A